MKTQQTGFWSWLGRWGGCALSLGAGFWLAVAPALAQDRPVRKLDESKAGWEWTIGTVFVVACLVVAFKNSKRSNVQ